MEQLVQIIVEKTGLSEEVAGTVAEIVLQFVKDKVPEPLAGQLDSIVNGEAGDGVDIGGALKGLFGQ